MTLREVLCELHKFCDEQGFQGIEFPNHSCKRRAARCGSVRRVFIPQAHRRQGQGRPGRRHRSEQPPPRGHGQGALL